MEMGVATPVKLPIAKIVDEAKDIKTFFFTHLLKSEPGQFIMVILPKLGMRPMSISSDNGAEFGTTICGVGPLSNAMMEKKPGDIIGIRGPLGKPFSGRGNHVVLVGGGYGSGPMAFWAERAIARGMDSKKIHYIVGARTKELLLFEERMRRAKVNLHIATNDGSHGYKGFNIDLLRQVIEEAKHSGNPLDMIYTCGPELMEKAVFDVAVETGTDCEISMERYMKCGIGICGSCAVDPDGLLICVDGPCVNKETAAKITEFGAYHRDASGQKVYYKKG